MLMDQENTFAPGWPGIPARWTSSAKSGVGTSCQVGSAVWFTISHGILNEIYYPRVDQACTRDMGFVVTDGNDFFSEEKRHASHQIEYLAEGVPAYRLVNNCLEGHYRLEKEIVTDPVRNSILQQVKFIPLKRHIKDYHLYIILAPHLANHGGGNTAWLGEYKGIPMLFAQRGETVLALACSIPWKNASVGFVGTSDSWKDLNQNKKMTCKYQRAENGNVALTGEIDLSQMEFKGFTLSLGFGRTPAAAAQCARASLVDGFDTARKQYIEEWTAWQKTLVSFDNFNKPTRDLYRISTFVLRTHAAKRLPGGLIASLSIPWGFSKGDDDIGGYHLVWPRDLVETSGGLLAARAWDDTRKVLNYLMTTQEADGHWPQNMWLDGTPYWRGIQMDEVGFPLLLVDMAKRQGLLNKSDIQHFWPMLHKAAGYLVCHGPVTQQDRWEENEGYTPFTLGVEIAALLAVADLAEYIDKPQMAAYLRETADAWNENIEKWLYVTNTSLAEEAGVEGYYVRIQPPDEQDHMIVKNRAAEENQKAVADVVSVDALALVRFGLRAADDPRILNTIKVIDRVLKVETPFGPCWRRYSFDGFGEHEDGSPYNGIGIGRAWPLLTGERAHYEIAAGRFEEAKRLMNAIEAFANEGGMIPEQIWDGKDIPERELFFGMASGSAMPLVWAHAEYIKLCRSLREKQVFDMPPQTRQRYVLKKTRSVYAIWNFNNPVSDIPLKKVLRIEAIHPFLVHWSSDDWLTVQDTPSRSTGFGNHIADLPTQNLPAGVKIIFTFYWTIADKWENRDYVITLNQTPSRVPAV